MPNDTQINIAAELKESVVNGPGKRYVIWVQGCCFNCPGCFNPEYQLCIPNILVNVSTLSRRILSVPSLEGVTYSGGEPLLQCKALTELNKILLKNGLSIVCYTGYTQEELRQSGDPCINKFLSQLDILIDGKFQQDKKENLLWRGSKNQKVHFLTDRYRHYESVIDYVGEMEIIMGNDTITYTGMLQDEIIKKLNDFLKK